ncbi:MAG: hypothetical protein ABR586_05580 [Thermoplasmatota archaeon]
MTSQPAVAVLILAALTLAPSVSADAMVQADFASPAQAHGNMTVQDAQWAVLLFHGAEATSFHLVLPQGAEQTNATFIQVFRPGPYPDNERVPIPLPESTRKLGPSEGVLHFGSPWAVLFVLADSVSLTALNTTARLDYAPTGNLVFEQLPKVSYPPGVIRDRPPSEWWLSSDQTSMGFQATKQGGLVPLRLQATGIRHLAWHNSLLECSSGECPDSGASWETSFDAVGETRAGSLSYIDLNAPAGWLEGTGQAWGIATGGHALDLSLGGRLRLPDATLHGACGKAACPDPAGKTFQASGELNLAHLTTGTEANRLRAGISGSFVAAFDETSIDWAHLWAEVRIPVAVIGGLGVAWALWLFSRQVHAKLTPERAAILEAVQAHPGSNLYDLARIMKMHRNTLSYHMHLLVGGNHVFERRDGKIICYFASRKAAEWKGWTALRKPEVSQLHRLLLEQRGLEEARVIEIAAREWGWPEDTTRYRVKSLRKADALRREPDVRGGKLYAIPPPESVSAPMPARAAASAEATA